MILFYLIDAVGEGHVHCSWWKRSRRDPVSYKFCHHHLQQITSIIIMSRLGQRGSFLGPALTVISVNIEGFSTVKQQILAELCSNLHCDVLCLLETSIPGMVFACERPHDQYGSAIFAKASSVIESTSVSADGDIEVLTVELSNIAVTSVYKPPAAAFQFPQSVLNTKGKPQIIIGDFNAHSTKWGYKESNRDGEAVEEWIDSNQLNLIHDPKLPYSFHSARWRRGYNPDLAFATNDIADLCQDRKGSKSGNPISTNRHPSQRSC